MLEERFGVHSITSIAPVVVSATVAGVPDLLVPHTKLSISVEEPLGVAIVSCG